MAQAMEILVQGVAYGKILGTRFPSEGLEQKVVGVLINAELNKSLLEHLPHRRLLDLALIYRVIVKTSDTGVTSAMVSHQMAGHYGFSEEDLFQAAIRNTPELMPVICQEMEREFYLLTNAHKINGASALLYEGILEQVAEELEDDLYILPSSIHEVFLVPATKHNLHLLKQVVRTANQEVVTQEELLSNSIYQYDRRSGQLTIAS
jgi:hypothetical protein